MESDMVIICPIEKEADIMELFIGVDRAAPNGDRTTFSTLPPNGGQILRKAFHPWRLKKALLGIWETAAERMRASYGRDWR